MKNGTKIMLIVAGALVLLGTGLATLGALAFGGFKSTVQYEKKDLSYDSGYTEISAEVSSGDITIMPVSGDKITLTYYDSQANPYTVSENGGTLTITRENELKWYQNIGIDWDGGNHSLTIGVPKSYSGKLTLQTYSGEIDAVDLTVSGDAYFYADFGSIDADNCTFSAAADFHADSGSIDLTSISAGGELTLSTDYGDISLNEITAGKNISVTQSTGDITGGNITASGKLSIVCDTGSTELEGVKASQITSSSSTGDSGFYGLDISSAITIQSDTGDIECTLTDGMENYTIISSTDTGSNNLPENAAMGEKSLTVTTSTGDIDFQFGTK